MVAAVDDVLTDSLAACVRDWFEQDFAHAFLSVPTVSVPDAVKPIPKNWVDEVELGMDEGFAGEEADVLGEGPTISWSFEEGRNRLRDSLARLGLREETIAHRELHNMSRHELTSEKRRVKQELKRYDSEFRKQYKRLPMHNDKEPMRPLYVYYRRLKTMLAHAEQSARGAGGRRSGAAPRDGDDDEGPTGLRLAPRDTPPAPPVDGEEAAEGGATAKDQIALLEARITSLQSEKSGVRARLQAFQERFLIENNRKIRFHKDILPIEREYRMYKQLKEEIMKAEAQMRDLQRG